VDSLNALRGHTISWFGLGGLRAKAPNFGADNPPALGPAGRVHMSLSDYATFLLDQLRGPRGEGVLLPAEEYRRLQGPGCNPAMAYGWGISEDGTLRHAGSNGMWYAEAALWSDEGLAMAIVSNDGRVDHQRGAFLQFMEEVRTTHLPFEEEGGE